MLIITTKEFTEPPYGTVAAGTRMHLSDSLAAALLLAGLAEPAAEQNPAEPPPVST